MKGFFDGVKAGMALFGEHIAAVVNTILLSFVYVVGVGLTRVIAYATQKKLLDKELGSATYWVDMDLEDEPYRMF